MRQARRGMTLTELLTVVSVITILASMMSPLILTAQKAAYRTGCASNIAQMHHGLQMVANSNFGKLPQCFDLLPGTSTVNEASWWPRKIARVMYPYDNQYDQLSVPYDDDPYWNDPNRVVQKFRSDRSIQRCQVSPDRPDQRGAAVPQADSIDKDRFYDENYGCNNSGFVYNSGVTLDPATGLSYFYHGRGPITGQYKDQEVKDGSGKVLYVATHVGTLTDTLRPADTLLLMDYVKADIAPPTPTATYDGYSGYRFRHGGRANTLFMDGHLDTYTNQAFLRDVANGTIQLAVKRRP